MDLILAFAVLFAAVIVSDLAVIFLDRRIQSMVEKDLPEIEDYRIVLRGESSVGRWGSWLFCFITVGLIYALLRFVLIPLRIPISSPFLLLAGVASLVVAFAYREILYIAISVLKDRSKLAERIVFSYYRAIEKPPVLMGFLLSTALLAGYSVVYWVVSWVGVAGIPSTSSSSVIFIFSLFGGFVGFDVAKDLPEDESTKSEIEQTQRASAVSSSPGSQQSITNQAKRDQFRKTQERRKQQSQQFTQMSFDWQWSDIDFDEIGGYDELKSVLTDEIIDPLRAEHIGDDRFTRFDVEPERGILFYGPPGTGKTLFARALAGELGVPFVELSPSDVASKWVNEGPTKIHQLFDEAARLGPTVVFIDEAEHLFGARGDMNNIHAEDRKMTTEFLVHLTSEDREAIVVAATNRPDDIDPAILRPGRLTSHYYVGLPEKNARNAILHSKLAGVPADIDSNELSEIATYTEGFTGADLAELVDEAKRTAARRNGPSVIKRDFPSADVLAEASQHLLRETRTEKGSDMATEGLVDIENLDDEEPVGFH